MKIEAVRQLWREGEVGIFTADMRNGPGLSVAVRKGGGFIYMLWRHVHKGDVMTDTLIGGGRCRSKTKAGAIAEAVRYLLKETP